jgi:hypothetical protein
LVQVVAKLGVSIAIRVFRPVYSIKALFAAIYDPSLVSGLLAEIINEVNNRNSRILIFIINKFINFESTPKSFFIPKFPKGFF